MSPPPVRRRREAGGLALRPGPGVVAEPEEHPVRGRDQLAPFEVAVAPGAALGREQGPQRLMLSRLFYRKHDILDLESLGVWLPAGA